MDKKFLRFERDYLIEIAGLKKTNETKKSSANKRLPNRGDASPWIYSWG